MTKLNPDFWETTLASESWEKFSVEDGLWHESLDDVLARQRRAEYFDAVREELRAVMNEVLTERQREVVLLYFFEELNQRQTAERLGISQQSVS